MISSPSNAATVGCNILAEIDKNVFVNFDDDVGIVEKLTDPEIIKGHSMSIQPIFGGFVTYHLGF